jgi:hypothetical protein
MKIKNYPPLKTGNKLCIIILFINVSYASVAAIFEDKPSKEKTSQTTENTKENNTIGASDYSRTSTVTCQPNTCIPVTITKSKTLVKSAEVFSTFLADSTMKVLVTANNTNTIYEYGLRFVVTKNGKMVKVGAKLPKAGIYRISVWDVTTKTVLVQQYVDQISNNIQSWADIPALALEANKEYFISIISNNWNDAYPKVGTTVTYPISKGNLKILAFAYASQPTLTSPPRYPDMEDNTQSISGFVDFGFIPN